MSLLIKRIQNFVHIMCNPKSTLFNPEDISNIPFVFTHGDYEPRNFLVDKDTLKITGLLDFEFSGSFPVDDDWFAGMGWMGGSTRGEDVFVGEGMHVEDAYGNYSFL